MSTILVMRHGAMRDALANLLKGMGIKSITGSTADVVGADLVIVDALSSRALPEMNGTPVIIITPFAGIDQNNTYYIKQPFEIDTFCDTVKQLVGQFA
jgi:hypothetical protein